ncbi:glycoside hydrolase family 43 protein [Granulicella sp. dw_53]|uniref:glycoside hydrolase family 43 protein n=1 Tax=Granulicella sp. dw_53 TaxID=2719792 RepID=UPI001BD3DA8A|nr:glycoside hydrolase family 43 protein [Granulicella sp. dw_53]
MPKLLRVAPLAAALLLLPLCGSAQSPIPPLAKTQRTDIAALTPWLFVGFKGNSEDGVYYALSPDGYHWILANGGKPVVPQTEPNELMRDPFIARGPDGVFHMVWTWSWRTPTVVGHATSKDLIHWTRHQQLPVMANEPTALNVWAPALSYEPDHKRWLIFWSSTIPGRFPGDDSGDGGLNHRIWSTTTTQFTSFTPAKIFFDPGYSVIDASLIQPGSDKKSVLIFKDERKTPLKKYLETADGPTPEGPWTHISPPISETWSEGAAIIPVHGGFLAYYDHYRTPQHYGALFSSDLTSPWTDATNQITFPAGLRHGSFVSLTEEEYDRIAALKPQTAPSPESPKP